MRQNSRRCAAFTLIELLVVLAIVVVLAAIAFAGSSSFISRSRAAGCMSSLRQLHAGAMVFAADNNNALPYFSKSADGKESFWIYAASDAALGSVGGSLCCPDSPYARGKNVSSGRIPQANYAMNGALYFTDNPRVDRLGLGRPPRVTDFPKPSQTVLFFDAGAHSISQRSAKDPARAWSYIPGYKGNQSVKTFYAPNPKVTKDAHDGRHGGFVHFVHMDGSVGRAKADEFVQNADYWNLHR